MIGMIGFENLRIDCIIGCLPKEREQSQQILVDLKAEADLSKSVQSDCIDDTVDYVALAQICTEIAQAKHYKLLETFAADVVKTIIARFPVFSVWIRVKKPDGLPNCDYTTVEFSRDKGTLGTQGTKATKAKNA